MALIRHRLPLLLAPVLAAPGMLPAPACHHQRLESWHATSCVPGHREQNIRGAGYSQRRITSACKGNAHVATHSTTSSAGHRPIPCRRQGRGQLSATGLREKLALQVAGSLGCPQSCLGPGTVHTTQALPDPNASTRRTGHRVPARDMTPKRHRRWRYGHHARARPARDRAHALTTNHLSYCTPPSQGGEITRVQFIHVCIPVGTGFLIRQKLSTLDVCCSSPEPEPHWRTCDRSSYLCLGRYEDTNMFLGRRKQTS